MLPTTKHEVQMFVAKALINAALLVPGCIWVVGRSVEDFRKTQEANTAAITRNGEGISANGDEIKSANIDIDGLKVSRAAAEAAQVQFQARVLHELEYIRNRIDNQD